MQLQNELQLKIVPNMYPQSVSPLHSLLGPFQFLPFFWNCCAERLGREHWEQAIEEPVLNFLQPGSGQRHFEAESKKGSCRP